MVHQVATMVSPRTLESMQYLLIITSVILVGFSVFAGRAGSLANLDFCTVTTLTSFYDDEELIRQVDISTLSQIFNVASRSTATELLQGLDSSIPSTPRLPDFYTIYFLGYCQGTYGAGRLSKSITSCSEWGQNAIPMLPQTDMLGLASLNTLLADLNNDMISVNEIRKACMVLLAIALGGMVLSLFTRIASHFCHQLGYPLFDMYLSIVVAILLAIASIVVSVASRQATSKQLYTGVRLPVSIVPGRDVIVLLWLGFVCYVLSKFVDLGKHHQQTLCSLIRKRPNTIMEGIQSLRPPQSLDTLETRRARYARNSQVLR